MSIHISGQRWRLKVHTFYLHFRAQKQEEEKLPEEKGDQGQAETEANDETSTSSSSWWGGYSSWMSKAATVVETAKQKVLT